MSCHSGLRVSMYQKMVHGDGPVTSRPDDSAPERLACWMLSYDIAVWASPWSSSRVRSSTVGSPRSTSKSHSSG